MKKRIPRKLVQEAATRHSTLIDDYLRQQYTKHVVKDIDDIDLVTSPTLLFVLTDDECIYGFGGRMSRRKAIALMTSVGGLLFAALVFVIERLPALLSLLQSG